jgi:hypothetical protein
MATVKVNGKNVNIADKEIEKAMKSLELTREEAIEMILDDMGLTENEEQNALDEKAKKVKINHQASADKEVKDKKPRTSKVTEEKQLLFSELCNFLREKEFDFEILKENKLISVNLGTENFKIDLINTRKPKK